MKRRRKRKIEFSLFLGLGLDLNNLVSTGFFVLTITGLLTLVFMFL